MNISKAEQRTLHALAQGGHILVRRDGEASGNKARPPISAVECYNRDGHMLVDCRLATFARLKKRGFIASYGGGPYRVTRAGLLAVRAQLDNR
ncbi:YjhX family toxin [Erythrobacter sp.]|uniref:YjhX family toxin n=1 Tax=Erythrobacter sp. TaxID=1042 RepID=UPI00311DBB2C